MILNIYIVLKLTRNDFFDLIEIIENTEVPFIPSMHYIFLSQIIIIVYSFKPTRITFFYVITLYISITNNYNCILI